MKKQWISVKCGLSRDPKHRQAMGESVWLFLHMLDMADWESGKVMEWKDEGEADEMGMPVRTLREHRRKLEELDYISCAQKQYGQEITIHNWTNPREYSGTVSNKKQGGKEASPSEEQGYTQGYTQGNSKDVTPTYDSKNQRTKKPAATPKTATPPEVTIFREVTSRYPNKVNYSDIEKIVQSVSVRLLRPCTADDLRPFFAAWTARGFNPLNIAWTSWAVTGIIPDHKTKAQPTEPRGFDAVRKWVAMQGEAVNNG